MFRMGRFQRLWSIFEEISVGVILIGACIGGIYFAIQKGLLFGFLLFIGIIIGGAALVAIIYMFEKDNGETTHSEPGSVEDNDFDEIFDNTEKLPSESQKHDSLN